MKKFLFFILSVALISCTKAVNEEDNIGNDDEIVTISLSKKFIEYNEPLSRAESNNDLYGFQVWEIKDGYKSVEVGENGILSPNICVKEDDKSKEAGCSPVCNGLYDNIDDITINLSKKHKYNIVLVYIPNGKNLVYRYPDGSYEIPFNLRHWSPNPFNETYYTAEDMIGLFLAQVNGKDKTYRSECLYQTNIDYYYGHTLNIEPKNNSIISINLKNMIWGLKIKAHKVEGYNYNNLLLTINPKGTESKKYTIPVADNNEYTEFVIPKIALGNYIYYPYIDDGYLNDVDIAIGTMENPLRFINNTFKIKRNVMKVIEFEACDDITTNGVDVIIDDSHMTEEIEIF